jgi:hypothetical protein
MMRPTRAAIGALLFTTAATLAGCASGPESSLRPSTTALLDDLKPMEPGARLARMQRDDRAAPPGSDLTTAAEQRARVRAHVNGTPIFDSEVMNLIMGRLAKAAGSATTPAAFTEVQAKIYNDGLEMLIDQEVVYQDAVHRLEKSSPQSLLKLKAIATQETDKRIQEILETAAEQGQKVSPEQIREITPMVKRQMERGIVYGEYLRSKVRGHAESIVDFRAVREYYEGHQNEFVRLDFVEWQDVFLAVGPTSKYRTLADARSVAEQLIATVRRPEDFAKLLPYDDGVAKFNGGKGFGTRRGEIKPVELEEYLFRMRDGEIGPVVELSTGVHIFRVIRREVGGQMPLDEKAQRKIREKLLADVTEREAKRIIRELRDRSVIEIEGS